MHFILGRMTKLEDAAKIKQSVVLFDFDFLILIFGCFRSLIFTACFLDGGFCS